MKDISTAKRTVEGYVIYRIKWNSAVNLFLGVIEDPLSEPLKIRSCSWTRTGKCVNRLRPDCDIDRTTCQTIKKPKENELNY